jgi:hypothetical protein
MAGMAANCSREEIKACIKAVEMDKGKSGSTPKLSLKTTSKQ